MTTNSTFRTGAATHVGLIRTMNEDSFMVGDTVFAVADGMGGHLAGEVASQLAIRALDPLDNADGARSVDGVVAAVITANDTILQMSRDDPTRRGMGTTLTAVALVRGSDTDHGDELAVVNLGDSRTYRFRDDTLEQITTDHSYVQELVMGGHLSANEARTHPQRNIVTRALGIEPGVGVDVWNVPLVQGDRFMLCSDGLVDEVTDERIADVLANLADPQAAAEHLVDMANRSGGRDNVTVIVVDVISGAAPEVLHVDGAPVDASRGEVPTLDAPTTEIPVVAAAAIADPMPAPLPDPGPGQFPDPSPADLAGLPPTAEVLVPPEAPMEAPTETPLPAPTKRRTNLKLVAVLGGLAVLIGVVMVAVRDGGDSEPTPTTVVTTVPAPTTTSTSTTIGVRTTAATPAPGS